MPAYEGSSENVFSKSHMENCLGGTDGNPFYLAVGMMRKKLSALDGMQITISVPFSALCAPGQLPHYL